MPSPTYPGLHDLAAWRALILEFNEASQSLLCGLPSNGPDVQRAEIAGVPVVVAQPPKDAVAGADKVVMDIHGGSLIFIGGKYLDPLVKFTAEGIKAHLVSVDYRMPPDHPFPAGLDDCVGVYRALATQFGPEKIVVSGLSAGGNLALGLMLRLKEAGDPLPAGLVLQSPEVDLTESGDSFTVLDGVDRLTSLMPVNLLYAAGMPLSHPHISPLFGDFSGGFPPTFIQAGTRDLFLSNAVRLHRALRRTGIEAELHVWEAMPHGGFFGAPEDAEVSAEIRSFISRCWKS